MPFGIDFFLLRSEITVGLYQLTDTLIHLIPFQKDMRNIITETARQFDTLSAMVFVDSGSHDNRSAAAPAVFVFQKADALFGSGRLLILLIDTELSL